MLRPKIKIAQACKALERGLNHRLVNEAGTVGSVGEVCEPISNEKRQKADASPSIGRVDGKAFVAVREPTLNFLNVGTHDSRAKACDDGEGLKKRVGEECSVPDSVPLLA